MNYKEYQNLVQSEYQNILKENVLFWNLWNITYPFEILIQYQDDYIEEYQIFNTMWNCCWEIIETGNIQIEKFKQIFEQNYPFVMDEETGEIINPKSILQSNYDEYSDDELPELCINQLIYRFDTIYKGIVNNEERYGEYAGNSPIEVIALIVASNELGFIINNMDLPIVNNEVEAQIKLMTELGTPQDFGFADRNRFRDSNAMNSITYQEY
ncbi:MULTISPECIES: hypothetical protein [Chryseobacterium]|uniref:Uncharacterized protein n=1 Tax=Chryseobacterium pennae TaxID=2258962 RepID=A0A3D9C233_9FLAO|nr:hypothetical protein [Chryseobacterium pennae]REC59788.1 hypothetical protein DRF65_23950 [Chryseobacterium pennae]